MDNAKPGILPFLYPHSLSSEEVERRLGRPLTGDPTRGERGVVAALGRTRIEAVRQSIEGDRSLGADFKEVITTHVAEMEYRWHTSKAWRVQIPGPVWEEYAHESRMSQRTVAECLSAAIQRDYDHRMRAADPVAALAADVRALHAIAAAIVGRLEATDRAAASIKDLGRQLQRIEDALVVGAGKPRGGSRA
jgi:hypothetical protein